MRRALAVIASACWLLSGGHIMAEGNKPTIKVEQEKHGDRVFTMVRIAAPTIPDFECDVWCYEDALGQGEGFPQPDGAMVVKHRHPQGAEVETKLTPSEGAIDWTVTVAGPTPEAVKTVGSVNGCWQLRRAPGFQSVKGKFVESFVNQCFIYTDRGFTLFKDTKRYPDTRRPADHETNSPPWVQQYLPIWQNFTGQPKAFWGISDARPIYSIVGVVSRDGKHLSAWGCKKSRNLSQGWHDCLHLGPDLSIDYDEKTNRTVSRLKMYFMEFDPDKLLAQYKADFPFCETLLGGERIK
ncbi:MAG: hypothetical protein AB1696_05995 [Planctomycetota bacterium]